MNGVRDTDHGARALLERARSLGASKAVVRVGILADAVKEVEPGEKPAPYTLLEIAAVHEFGAPAAHIPQRSFIRGTVDAKHAEIATLQTKLGAQALKGAVTEDVALERLGAKVVAMVQNRIAEGIAPELAQSTSDAKGSSTPLVDTGQLKSSVTYAVVREG